MRSLLSLWLLILLLGGCAGGLREGSRFELQRNDGIAFVRERSDAPERLRNATVRRGVFFVRDGCLAVLVDGIPYTPLLPKKSQLLPAGQGLRVGSEIVQLGPIYSLPFANELEVNPDQVVSEVGLPQQCPKRLLSVGQPSLATAFGKNR